MNNSGKFRMTAAALLIALAGYLSGCSAVGYGMGAAVDVCIPDHRFVDKEKADKIKPDTPVTLYLSDGSQKNGIIYAVNPESSSIILGNTEEYIVSESYRQLALNHSSISEISTRHPGIKPSPKEYFDLEEVNLIEVPRKKHGKAVGLYAGLAGDIVFFILLVSGAFWPGGSSWLGN